MIKAFAKYSWIIFVFISMSFFAQAQHNANSENELKKQADKSFNDEKYESALNPYSQLLSLYPKDPIYNYRYGVCLLIAGKEKSSASSFLEAASKTKMIPSEVWYYLGQAEMINGDFIGAISSFQKYKTFQRPKLADVDVRIANCRNAIDLLKSPKQVSVVSESEQNFTGFYNLIDFTNAGGKFSPTADQFISPLDREKKVEQIMFISNDKQTVLISSYGKNAANGKDVYIIRKMANGQWSVPESLGSVINTSGNEDFPFLDRDGKTLYFSSTGHNSIGERDLFKSVLDLNNGQWSVPENLGLPVNTVYDDWLFVPTGTGSTAFVVTSANADKNKILIKKIDLPGIANSLVKISGVYLPIDQRVRRDARISILNSDGKGILTSVHTDPRTGNYELVLPPGKEYMIVVEGGGYLPHAEVFDLPATANVPELRQVVKVNHTKESEDFTLQNFFSPSEAPTQVMNSTVNPADTSALVLMQINDQLVYVSKPKDHSTIGIQNKTIRDSISGLPTVNIQKKDKYDPTLERNLSNDELRQKQEEETRLNEISNEEKNPTVTYDVSISNEELSKVAFSDAREIQREADRLKNEAARMHDLADAKDSIATDLIDDAAKAPSDKEKKALLNQAESTREEAVELNAQATELDSSYAEKQREAATSLVDAKAIFDNDAIAMAKINKKNAGKKSIASNGNHSLSKSGQVENTPTSSAEIAYQTSASDSKAENDTSNHVAGKVVVPSGNINEINSSSAISKKSQTNPLNSVTGTPATKSDLAVVKKEGSQEPIKGNSLLPGGSGDVKSNSTTGPLPVNAKIIAATSSKSESPTSVNETSGDEKSGVEASSKAQDQQVTPTVSNSSVATKSEEKQEPSISNSGDAQTTLTKKDNTVSDPKNPSINKSADGTSQTNKSLVNTTLTNTNEDNQNTSSSEQANVLLFGLKKDNASTSDTNSGNQKATSNGKVSVLQSGIKKDSITGSNPSSENQHPSSTELANSSPSFAKNNNATPSKTSENTGASDSTKVSNSPTDNKQRNLLTQTGRDIQQNENTASGTNTSVVEKVKNSSVIPSNTASKTVNPAAQQPSNNSSTPSAGIKTANGQTINTTIPAEDDHLSDSIHAGSNPSVNVTSQRIADEAKSGNATTQQLPGSSTSSVVPSDMSSDSTIKGEKRLTDPVSMNTTNSATSVSGSITDGKSSGAPSSTQPSGTVSHDINSNTQANELPDTVGRGNISRNQSNINSSPSVPKRSTTDKASDVNQQTPNQSKSSTTTENGSGINTVVDYDSDPLAGIPVKEEARLAYTGYRTSGKISQQLDIQSMALQERISSMKNSPEKDSLVRVSNEMALESIQQWQLSQKQLQEAKTLDPSIEGKVIQGRFAPTPIASNVEAKPPGNDNTIPSQQASNDGQLTSEKSLAENPAKDIEKPASSNNSNKSKSPIAEQSNSSGVSIQDHSSQDQEPAISADKNIASARNKTEESTAPTLSDASIDGSKVEKKSTTDSEKKLANQVVANVQTNSKPSADISYTEKSNTISSVNSPVKLDTEGLNVNHPKYQEYIRVQQQVNEKQVATIDVFAKAINLNKKAVEEKDAQVSLMDLAQQEKDETKKKEFLKNADRFKALSQKDETDSKVRFDEAKQHTNEVKQLASKLKDIRTEIAGATTASAEKKSDKLLSSQNRITTGNSEVASENIKQQISKNNSYDVKRNDPLYVSNEEVEAAGNPTDEEVTQFRKTTFNNTASKKYTPANKVPMDEPLPNGLVFKVQIGAFHSAIDGSKFNGLEPVTGETTRPGWVRYCVGLFKTFEPANAVKKEMRNTGYKDAFVVAYRNGKRIGLDEAYAMLNKDESLKTAYKKQSIKELAVLKAMKIQLKANANADTKDEDTFYGTNSKSVVTNQIYYTVQIGVYRTSIVPSALRALSPVEYDQIKANLFRFTYGVYSYYQAADSAKRIAVKAGIADAFIIAYQNGKRVSASVLKATTDNLRPVSVTVPAIPVEKKENVEPTPLAASPAVTSNSDVLVYKIQLGAFRQMVPFEKVEAFLKVSDKGITQQADDRGLHIFYAGNCPDFSCAQQLKAEIISKGIADAFIVPLRGNKRIPLTDDLKK